MSIFFKSKPKFASATDHVKHVLKTKGQINQLECLDLTGSWRLGDIIWRLRKQGMDIISTEKEVTTRYNAKTHVAVYHFKPIKTVILLVTFIFFGCNEPNVKTKDSGLSHGHGSNNFQIIELDSCEYFFYIGGPRMALAHKGNCKFCKIRN